MGLSTIILETGGVFAAAVNQDGFGNIGVNVENFPAIQPVSGAIQLVDGPNATYGAVIQGAAGYAPLVQIKGSATKVVRISRIVNVAGTGSFFIRRYSSAVTIPSGTPIVSPFGVGGDSFLTGNVAQFQYTNSFVVGAPVQFSGLTNLSFLNGLTLVVLPGVGSGEFHVNFTHANVGAAQESGSATFTPQATATTVPAGLADTDDSAATAIITYYAGTGSPVVGTLVSTFSLQSVNEIGFGVRPGTKELVLRGVGDYITIEPLNPVLFPVNNNASLWIEWTEE
jgi:hypothetical protein